MDELLELIKKFEKIHNEEYWLVAYTDGIIEVHNDHRVIILTTDLGEAIKQLNERMQ